jgi:UDP-glucose 4-epimerase
MKRAMEVLASAYPHTLALRIFPVYGGTEKHSVISKWFEEVKNDKQPTIYGDGTQKRDFIHIDDVVDQILLLESMKVAGVADIGSGNPISFNDILKTINEVLGKDVKPIYLPKPKDYSDGIFCKNPLPVKRILKNVLGENLLGQ